MKLICGDALEELKNLPAESVDAMVTDPPAGISFMGKSWDGDKGGRKQWIDWMAEMMAEASRVLKPGAHALVWALPRTSHWTATSLEDAGFEIRDVVLHLFGSGFPKSLDVGKAIDKAAGAERRRITMRSGRTGLASQPNRGSVFSDDNYQWPGKYDITAPATNEAKQWDGWGTALKPASEHWILARKPLSEPTVAANVLKWGTGAINIDGTRISGSKPDTVRGAGGQNGRYGPLDAQGRILDDGKGRFPSNVVLDQEAARMLDDQSGEIKSGFMAQDQKRSTDGGFHGGFPADRIGAHDTYGDSGGASRFFYVAKPSRAERNDGLEGREKKDLKWSNGTENPNSFQEGESSPTANYHPTVKAVELMRYLCRLITPPKGIILDPFMGSGSTGIAAHEEGFDFIGIEREKEYFEIAQGRIKAATAQQRMFV